jgi:hypothetical protein
VEHFVAQRKNVSNSEKEIVTMKTRLASAICLLLILCHAVFGQEVRRVQEPEYLGIFFLLDSSTGNLVPLERQTPEGKVKVKAMGFGGGESVLEIKGEKSPIRFKEGHTLEFVVLVSSQQIDPQGSLQFFSLESKKGKRQLILAKAGSMGRSGKSTMSEKAVPFNATKYGTSSFKITPVQNLPPGEYTLSTSGTNAGFCFGIDPANPKQ